MPLFPQMLHYYTARLQPVASFIYSVLLLAAHTHALHDSLNLVVSGGQWRHCKIDSLRDITLHYSLGLLWRSAQEQVARLLPTSC